MISNDMIKSFNPPKKVIDCHTHVFPAPMMTTFINYLKQTGSLELGPHHLWTSPAFENLDRHIEDMDQYGINTSLITFSSNTPSVINAAAPSIPEKVHLISWLNDQMIEEMGLWGGRILPTAWVDPSLGESALSELDRVVANGIPAISVLTAYLIDGKLRFLDHSDFEPFWRLVASLNIPVFVHFSARFSLLDNENLLKGNMLNAFLGGGLSALVENTLCLTRLILSGLFDRYPNLKIIMGQLGGVFPFILGRFDYLYEIFAMGAKENYGENVPGRRQTEDMLRRLRDYVGNVYVDTYSMDKAAIMCALEVLGSDRVLFGSDFPITPSILGRERGLDTIYSLPVPSEVKTAILGGSAVKLLQL